MQPTWLSEGLQHDGYRWHASFEPYNQIKISQGSLAASASMYALQALKEGPALCSRPLELSDMIAHLCVRIEGIVLKGQHTVYPQWTH